MDAGSHTGSHAGMAMKSGGLLFEIR